jgi:hypothetical protein
VTIITAQGALLDLRLGQDAAEVEERGLSGGEDPHAIEARVARLVRQVAELSEAQAPSPSSPAPTNQGTHDQAQMEVHDAAAGAALVQVTAPPPLTWS